ncbi:MAG TPA: hypothetical protein VLB46_22740 [Pyrinomonadaceae bacterium]|nr:hypothetical protein [Pyrinomonadaceae bacterium]
MNWIGVRGPGWGVPRMANNSRSLIEAVDNFGRALERVQADKDKDVAEAIDRLRDLIERKTTEQHKAVIEALDKLQNVLESHEREDNIDYSRIKNGPVEHVLAFNNDEFIELKNATTKNPYFSSRGVLTNLHHRELPGSKVETTFPVDPDKIGESFNWPPEQVEPFRKPPLDFTNTTGHGYSKQAYFFDGGSSSLVTVGPSLPKIAVLKKGGAQFWVCSIGVVTQGTGKYQGVRGASVYLGSAYLETWPKKFEGQIKILAGGFDARVSTYFKLVFKNDHS